ncbi:DMT family transporter [Caballeronia sp. DA-9]|uniref:DMT family transporter n=1 Tax=Caballeronia sp. DA-9 TaxID=3436237 RepID=UPI003F66F1B8
MNDACAQDIRVPLLAGILFTVFAYFLFSGHDALIKLVVAGLTVWQIMFCRSIIILTTCGVFGGRKLLVETLQSPILRPMFIRSAFIFTAWICYYNAAKSLQLAELSTIYFAAPVIVTALSVLMLGEIVPPLRWAAVFIGFAGVVVACDPTRIGITLPIALALVAAFLWSISLLLLRTISLRERATVQLVLNNTYFMLFSAVPAILWWRVPDLLQSFQLIGVAVLGGAAQFMLLKGINRTPLSILGPLEYTSLLWAFILGFAIWHDLPRTEVLVGAVLIIAGGLLMVGDEHFRKRV